MSLLENCVSPLEQIFRYPHSVVSRTLFFRALSRHQISSVRLTHTRSQRWLNSISIPTSCLVCSRFPSHTRSLSLSIFVTLIRQFKPHLKTEIGVFLDNIFLRVAENPNSTFGHKMMILQVFSKLAQDPQTIVDIFLNYDCDDKAVPIFQHLVSVLEKITQVFLVASHRSLVHSFINIRCAKRQ